MTCKLTIVLTAHRVEHLPAALRSVAAQSSADFELVCCADVAAGAGPLELMERAAATMPSRATRIIAVNGTGTAGYVRNRAIDAARTPWVSYLDGDDVLSRDAVATVLRVLDDDDGRHQLFSSGLIRIDRRGRRRGVSRSLRYRPPLWIYTRDPDQAGHATYFNQLQVLRKADWERYPYDETTNGEDIDYALHQLLWCQFAKIPAYLYGYRDSPDSFSQQQFPGGDLCSRRYQEGYYARLFNDLFTDELRDNFAADSSPAP